MYSKDDYDLLSIFQFTAIIIRRILFIHFYNNRFICGPYLIILIKRVVMKEADDK